MLRTSHNREMSITEDGHSPQYRALSDMLYYSQLLWKHNDWATGISLCPNFGTCYDLPLGINDRSGDRVARYKLQPNTTLFFPCRYNYHNYVPVSEGNDFIWVKTMPLSKTFQLWRWSHKQNLACVCVLEGVCLKGCVYVCVGKGGREFSGLIHRYWSDRDWKLLLMPLIWVRTSLQYDTHIVASTTVQKSRGGVSQPLNLSTRSNGMDLILEAFVSG